MRNWYPLASDEKIDFRSIDDAFRRGDLAAVRRALNNPEGFPNCSFPPCHDWPLIYAIAVSPVSFIRELLEAGADPNVQVDDGFPPLIAALTHDRKDRNEAAKLLLEFGADVHQRGVNGWMPLHCAAHKDDPEAVELLLKYGADPEARTNVDHYETALEEAERGGHKRAVKALRKTEKKA